MERYESLSQILSGDKKNQVEFLKSVLDLTLIPGEIEESQEPVFAKAILYLTCWVIMPKSSVSILPPEFKQIFSLLEVDTTELVPMFFERFLSCYEHLPEIICNDTLVSISLTVNDYGLRILSALKAHHCIPPLLWLLTYSPDHLKLAISFLPIAISKPNGVHELILAFSRGDDSFQLKNLAIKVLKSTPLKDKSGYLKSVIPQMMTIITEFKCDPFVENILEQCLVHFLQKYPDEFLKALNEAEPQLGMDELVKFYQILTQTTPPHTIILYRISLKFILYMNLFEYLCEHSLEIKGKLTSMLIQFFGYWEESIVDLIAYIENPATMFCFTLSDEGRILSTSKEILVKPIDTFNHISKIIEVIASSHVAAKVTGKLFSALLISYNQRQSFGAIYFITYMLSNLEPIFLVNLTSHIQDFLSTTLNSSDEKLIAISLQILSQSIPGNYDKSFLISISKRIIELLNSSDPLISSLSLKVNECISESILSNNLKPSTEKEMETSKVMEELESPEVYTSAIAAYRLSLLIPQYTVVPWKNLHNQLSKDNYIFGELLKCYLAGLKKEPIEGLEELFLQYEISGLDDQSRILEILFHWARSGFTIENHITRLMKFLNQIVDSDCEDELKNGAMVIFAKIIKRVKASSHVFLIDLINSILSIISCSNSRLFTNEPILKSTAAALLVLQKILKHSYFDHYKSYLNNIKQKIDIFDAYYKQDDNIRILIDNVLVDISRILPDFNN